jgi:hypothetical protein
MPRQITGTSYVSGYPLWEHTLANAREVAYCDAQRWTNVPWRIGSVIRLYTTDMDKFVAATTPQIPQTLLQRRAALPPIKRLHVIEPSKLP